jgi:hypothetical protein
MQFMKFVEKDTQCHVLLNVDEIVGVRAGDDTETSTIITKHGQFHVHGNSTFILSVFENCFGAPWDCVDEDSPDEED